MLIARDRPKIVVARVKRIARAKLRSRGGGMNIGGDIIGGCIIGGGIIGGPGW